MSDACERCLRRGHLLGVVAPQIARVLAASKHRAPGLLALSDAALIAAVCSVEQARAARSFLDTFDPGAAAASLMQEGIEATCRHGDAYPRVLLGLSDPPAALFVAGGVARLQRLAGERVVTIVGTRRPSAYGLDTARALARGLAAAGLTVVSGLALGIDAAAHEGALDGSGVTVAVLARGPESAYPRTHARLYDRVVDRGCVVAELPPGVPVYRWSFPARNRIMAALAEMTIVVEADDPSGSLITARFAAELNRMVAAVPGRVSARTATGTNGLLRDGACVVRGAQDVLDELFGAGMHAVPGTPPLSLEPRLAAVLEAVESCDGAREIGQRTGFAAGAVRAALGRLELLGLVKRDGLGAYRRAAS